MNVIFRLYLASSGEESRNLSSKLLLVTWSRTDKRHSRLFIIPSTPFLAPLNTPQKTKCSHRNSEKSKLKSNTQIEKSSQIELNRKIQFKNVLKKLRKSKEKTLSSLTVRKQSHEKWSQGKRNTLNSSAEKNYKKLTKKVPKSNKNCWNAKISQTTITPVHYKNKDFQTRSSTLKVLNSVTALQFLRLLNPWYFSMRTRKQNDGRVPTNTIVLHYRSTTCKPLRRYHYHMAERHIV